MQMAYGPVAKASSLHAGGEEVHVLEHGLHAARAEDGERVLGERWAGKRGCNHDCDYNYAYKREQKAANECPSP